MKNKLKLSFMLGFYLVLITTQQLLATNHLIEPGQSTWIRDKSVSDKKLPNTRCIIGFDKMNLSIEDLDLNTLTPETVAIIDDRPNHFNLAQRIIPEALDTRIILCPLTTHGSNVTSLISEFAPNAKLCPLDKRILSLEYMLDFILFDSRGLKSPRARYINISCYSYISPYSYNRFLELGRLGVGIVVAGGNWENTLGQDFIGPNAISAQFFQSCLGLAIQLENENAPGFLEFALATSYKGKKEKLARFSSKGSLWTYGYAIAAPGKDIIVENFDGSKGIVEGTSFSAPIVTGVLAHLTQSIKVDMSQDKYLQSHKITAREVLNIVHDSARFQDYYKEKDLGTKFANGVIDTDNAWYEWITYKKPQLRKKLRRAQKQQERILDEMQKRQDRLSYALASCHL